MIVEGGSGSEFGVNEAFDRRILNVADLPDAWCTVRVADKSQRNADKIRLDRLLVERGIAQSGAQARAMIMAGLVELPGRGQARPTAGMRVHEDEQVRVKARPRYVSRGGDKLANALDAFGLDPDGKTALDVGASTGGFTDCLLQRGATRVYAVDVGRGQLHNRLLVDDRVVSMERVNARKGFELPERVDLITADVSFISLRLVLPPALVHLRVGGAIIALLKPQFEAGPEKVGKGGVVRDRDTHAETIGQFVDWATAERLRVLNLTTSPLLGDKGNREFFFLLGRSPSD